MMESLHVLALAMDCTVTSLVETGVRQVLEDAKSQGLMPTVTLAKLRADLAGKRVTKKAIRERSFGRLDFA